MKEITLLNKGANVIILLINFVHMESKPVKIFTTSKVARLKYIAGFILDDMLGLPWEMVTDRRKLGKNPVINYSAEDIPGSFRMSPSSIIFESGTGPKDIRVSEWNGLPVFFQTEPGSDIPFDIFAASFYLLSRYEEYLGFEPDEYGRFRSSSSLAARHGFLKIPVVDLWVKEFARCLLQKFRTLAFKRNEYSSLMTIDVDEAFAYRGKGFFRNMSGFIHDITKGTGHQDERFGCIARGEKDPYEVFGYISEQIGKNNSDAMFFFPVGDHSQHDKNPSWKNEYYRELIKNLTGKYKTGIHPSYAAGWQLSSLRAEIERLASILDHSISLSRFHFLRLRFPLTLRNASASGITCDYSMGYSDTAGFRAGIARPYYFYDLNIEQVTGLKIIPFQLMDTIVDKNDGTENYKSETVILEMINEVKKAGGLFVSVWHNTSLLDDPQCKKMRSLFEFTLANQHPG